MMTLLTSVVFAQTCPAPIVPAGDLVNVITNPGFETGVIAPGNTGPHTLLPVANSSPGTYMINGNSTLFNIGMIGGITPHSGTQMLMIDGTTAPNAVAWEQTVTVQAGKVYYFSAWLTSLSLVEQSQMVFQIEPLLPVAGPSVDISASFIPSDGPLWTQEFGSWASGTTTQVKVRLVNKNPLAVGGLGNDYAIDDIMFRPTCVGTTAGPKPNFGAAVIGICNNGGSVNLNSNVANNVAHTYTWFRGVTGVANVTTPDILEAQTLPGTYKVCIDSAGCVNSTTVVLQAALTLDLGPDVNLCNPAFILLDTRITAPGTFTITWYRNAVLIPGATGTTYMATAAGTYRVDVTDGASCTGTDQIVVTSQVDATVSATYCAPASTATVSVVNSGGIYNWYSAATGGSSIAAGLNYNATGLTAVGSPYTFYVENSIGVSSTAGMLNNSDPALGTGSFTLNNIDAQTYILFTATTTTTLTQVNVLLNMGAAFSGNVNIKLIDITAASTVTATSLVTNPGVAGVYTKTIPLSLTLIAGHNYQFSIVGTGTAQMHRYQNVSGYYPKVYTAVTMTGSQAPNIYPGIFDWRFSTVTTCARTPATITNICPLPITLLDFTAKYIGPKTVAIQWSTASEVNNDYFTIQRSSDGIHFTDIQIVDGAGNSSMIQAYNDIDDDALDGISYYRLKQTDYDGQFSYSKIVTVVSNGTGFSFNLSPTLCSSDTEEIKILITGALPNQEIPLEIIDMIGRRVYYKTLKSDENGTIMDVINLNTPLARGTYVVNVLSSNCNEHCIQKIMFVN